jgi:phosphatidate cytidylyltransferase
MITFVKRSISSVFLIGFCVFGIYAMPFSYFSIAVSAFLLLALYEFYTLVDRNAKITFKATGLVSGLLLLLARYFSVRNNTSLVELALCFTLFLMFLFCILEKRSLKSAFKGISISFTGLIYIVFLGSYLLLLRVLPNGIFLIFFVIGVVKIGDIGAYIIGSRFGKHKIMPRISPKKSLEGCIAGVVSSVLLGIVLGYVFNSILGFALFSLLELIVLSIIINAIGQFGDMCESIVKREFNIKDSGGVIPGIGGVFDLIDSLIFTIPFMYYYSLLTL